MDLTDTNDQTVLEVGELVFAFISMIRSLGIQGWVLKEYTHLQKLNYNFQFDTATYNLVQDSACPMFGCVKLEGKCLETRRPLCSEDSGSFRRMHSEVPPGRFIKRGRIVLLLPPAAPTSFVGVAAAQPQWYVRFAKQHILLRFRAFCRPVSSSVWF